MEPPSGIHLTGVAWPGQADASERRRVAERRETMAALAVLFFGVSGQTRDSMRVYLRDRVRQG